MDTAKLLFAVPVMNEMQFCFPSEPCKSAEAAILYVVFLVRKRRAVKRRARAS